MIDTENKIKAFCDNKIIAGPFKGMTISGIHRFGVGHSILKLLGTFEQPIHPCINIELCKKHDLFVNIGCGDGYYGIGVKLKSPETHILMVDTDELCEAETKITGFLNGVSDYEFSNGLSSSEFEEKLGKYSDPWVFVDIEGAEVDVLDPKSVPNLLKATITVEAHDCFRLGVTNELIARFGETHDIVNMVDNLEKTIPKLPDEISLSDEVLHLINHERRCTRMNWLHMAPRKL